ncbi:MAG: M48 family metallopeptidase [Anaerocolumna sp.]
MIDKYKMKYKDGIIELEIIRSKRKSISVEFHLTKGIMVRIPERLRDKDLVDFLVKKEGIIKQKYEKVYGSKGRYQTEPIEKIYVNGSKLPFLSEEISLMITDDIKMIPSKHRNDLTKSAYVNWYEDKVQQTNTKTLLIVTMVTDIHFLRECVVNRYKEQAKIILKKKTDQYAKIMKVHYNGITIKEQKTRWGSCSSLGNLNYNWKLIMMPEEIVDYVVVHELSHLIYMNHQKEFWLEVSKVLPDYNKSKDWLGENGILYQKY